LTGYRKLEEENIPSGYKAAATDDPYPISLFNEAKTIPDNKIGKYLNQDFFYYVNIYENNKTFGNLYKSWLDMPHWLIQLHKLFLQTEIEFENYQLSKRF